MRQQVTAKLRQRKELRYVVSGITSEVIEYASFFALLGTTHFLVLANSISFILGIASGFVFHKLWSFAGDQQFKTHQQLTAYVVLATVNFFVVNVLIVVLVDGMHVWVWLAKLMTMTITAALSYLVFNTFIFRHQR